MPPTQDFPSDQSSASDVLLDLDFTIAEITRLRKENKNNLLQNLVSELTTENDYLLQQIESN